MKHTDLSPTDLLHAANADISALNATLKREQRSAADTLAAHNLRTLAAGLNRSIKAHAVKAIDPFKGVNAYAARKDAAAGRKLQTSLKQAGTSLLKSLMSAQNDM